MSCEDAFNLITLQVPTWQVGHILWPYALRHLDENPRANDNPPWSPYYR